MPATAPITAMPVGLAAPPVEAEVEPVVSEAAVAEAAVADPVDMELIMELIIESIELIPLIELIIAESVIELIIDESVIIELMSVSMVPLAIDVKPASELRAEPSAEDADASALVAAAEALASALVAAASSVTSWPSDRMPFSDARLTRSV